jgi:hypothetical protein
MSIPYILGGITTAFVVGYPASAAMDFLIVRRLVADRLVAILISCILAYPLVVILSAFGHSRWSWPPTLVGVPLLTLAAGVALSGLLRLKLRKPQPNGNP